MKHVLSVVLLLAGLAPALASDIRERTTYFTLRGSTLAELDRDFETRGPLLGATGQRHMGATKVEFDGHVTYLPGRNSCQVDKARLRLDLEMMLPRWKPRREASPETARIWRTLSRDIERHELEHAQIAKTWLRKMENAIRGLGPERDCVRMEARVDRTASIFLARHEKEQRAFDAREGREMAMRLRRALRDEAHASR